MSAECGHMLWTAAYAFELRRFSNAPRWYERHPSILYLLRLHPEHCWSCQYHVKVPKLFDSLGVPMNPGLTMLTLAKSTHSTARLFPRCFAAALLALYAACL